MSQEQVQVAEKTQQMLQGPLKHVRAAALAAALVPLASVMATPASAQPVACPSAGLCGTVWNDTNNNGIHDAGESPIDGAVVTANGSQVVTDSSGSYYFAFPPGTYEVSVAFPDGAQASPTNAGTDDTIDSDGTANLVTKTSVATVTFPPNQSTVTNTDFGFAPEQSTPGVPAPCDFITSGGFVFTDGGAEANFGAHGGCKLGEFWGHVNFVDHSTGYHLNSVEITGYLSPFPGSTTRDICGLATTNRPEPQPVPFRVRLTDNGEPGVADTFGIAIGSGPTGYRLYSRLLGGGKSGGKTGGGGNVQLHEPNKSTTGPNPSPSEAAMCAGVPAPQ